MNNWETIQFIQQKIFSLNKENVVQVAISVFDIFDNNYQYSFNLLISQIIYSSFVSGMNDFEIYMNFIKEIKKIEDKKQIQSKIHKVFLQMILNIHSQESNYFLERMIQENLCKSNIVKQIREESYFIHYMSKKFLEKNKYLKRNMGNFEELSKNDWELHKKLIKEGANPNEIARIIRNDEIGKLQEISSQTNFDFNQTIEPSVYERHSFINQNNITLIDYAAFFRSIKCFKYLLMNGSNIKNAGKYAVAGGNEEIIHLCEQNHSSFKDGYEAAIEFHRNNIFKYLYENKITEINNLEEFGKKCISSHNYEIFIFLQKEGMPICENIINESTRIGNIFLIKHFLESNQIPKNILVFSSKSGNIELVKYILIQEGIDINAKNNYGNTALIKASRDSHIEIVKLLLEQEGIDINAKNNYGNTALIRASNNGRTEIVKLLLEQEGIDINAKNNYGYTALMNASDNGYTEVVKLLLEQEGIDINAKNEYGYTALMNASLNDRIEIVKLLLEQEGIDINAKNNYENTALILAAESGNIEIVKLLLEQEGIDINTKNEYGKTALIRASNNGRTETVKLLLEQEGIDINAKDNNENTALIRASDNGYTEIVKLLLEQEGIDINTQNNDGNTPLILASQSGHTEIVKLLLTQKGVDINTKNNHGQTAHIFASENGHIEIVNILLEQE